MRLSASLRAALRCCLLGFAAAPVCAHLQAQAKESYRVVHAYPHDPDAFTQGLVFADGQLYESTGLNGHSSLRRDQLATGQVLQEHIVPQQFFAEGLTNWGDTLIQLTWKAHTAFVYDRRTFQLLRTFSYPWEGWGLTQDGHDLILSDGSATLHFLDPKTFGQVRSVVVTEHGQPVKELNELEYIHGEIYANLWMANRIVCISPRTGQVLASIDLAGILPEVDRRNENAVLNGIAYDAAHERLFVTGKLWPELFEIRVVPAGAAGSAKQ